MSTSKSRFRKYLRPSLVLLAIGIVSSLLLGTYHFVRVQNRLAVWQDMRDVVADFTLETLHDEVNSDETFWMCEIRGGDVLGDLIELGIDATECELGLLADLPNLQVLRLYASDENIVTAEMLRMIRHRYPNLEDFELSNAELDDSARKELAAFSGLEYLSLRSVNVSDDDLLKLLSQSKFVSLELSACSRITERGLAGLQSQFVLEQLMLDRCEGVTDSVLEICAKLPQVTLLDFEQTRVTGEGLRWLSGLKSLHLLNLSHTGVNSESIEHLLGLTSLTYLSLEGTAIDDRGVERLGVLALEDLDLDGTLISDEALKHLGQWPKLGGLSVNETAVTDKGLKFLETSDSLFNFNCDGTYATSAAARRLMASRAVGFQTIDIGSWWNANRYSTATGQLVGGFPGIPDSMSMSGLAVFSGAGGVDVETAQLRRIGASSSQWIPGTFGSGAISSDGSIVALGYRDRLTIFDAPTGQVIREIATHETLRELCFWDSERIAATLYGDQVKVWDVRTGRQICAVTSECADECRFSPNGERLLVWGDTSGAEVIDVASGKVVQTFSDAFVAAFLPDGDLVWVPYSVDGAFVLRNATEGREQWRHVSDRAAVLFSPDGSLVAVGSELEQQIAIFDTVDGTRCCTIPTSGDFPAYYDLFFTPDNQQLLYSSGSSAIYD